MVSTPIGNLADISFRAVDTLKSVQLILCEDTRTFRTLASRFGIATPTRSYHDQNEKTVAPQIVEQLKGGSSVALVAEAGTPTISDPGYRLVSACKQQGVAVRTIPGACAGIAALSISGFETDKFYFEGFLPKRPGKLRAALRRAVERDCTTVIYESPHRILKTLGEVTTIAPSLELCVCRELTKIYEEVLHGSAGQIIESLTTRKAVRGEFVLLIRGSCG